MPHYIVYDKETNQDLVRHSAAEDSEVETARSKLKEGLDLIIVPIEAIQCVGPADVSLIKSAYQNMIDTQAEYARAPFIPTGAGLALTYIEKAAEAHAYLVDENATTPILTAEAAALDITVHELAEEVAAAALLWREAAGAIEALRRGAKKSIEDAETFDQIKTAAQPDWQTELAPFYNHLAR